MAAPRIALHDTQKVVRGAAQPEAPDELAVEEPVEIRVRNDPVSVTMRTPGDDFDLAAGFLFTEGILKSSADIGAIRYCSDEKHPDLRNVIDVTPATGVTLDLARARRNFTSNTSCGLCGKAAIEDILQIVKPITARLRVKAGTITSLAGRLRDAQEVFARTGGLHAVGVFDQDGTLRVMREDVGRHNATDKAIGSVFLEGGLPLDRHILMVSGRASFEIVQKAAMAGIPVLCAVSAPSSLAVEFAETIGMTLIGFLRGESFNIYCGRERVEL